MCKQGSLSLSPSTHGERSDDGLPCNFTAGRMETHRSWGSLTSQSVSLAEMVIPTFNERPCLKNNPPKQIR